MSCPHCPVFAASGTGAPCKCGRERERSKDTAEYAVIDSSRFRNGVTASTRGSTSPNTFIADSRRDGGRGSTSPNTFIADSCRGRGIVRGDPGRRFVFAQEKSCSRPDFPLKRRKSNFNRGARTRRISTRGPKSPAAVPRWHLRPREWLACQQRLHGRPSRFLCPGRKHRAHELPIMGLLPWSPGGHRQ